MIAALTVLGWWQFTAYDAQQHNNALAVRQLAPVALDDVMSADAGFPAEAFGRPVTVRGRYVTAEQFYVQHLPGSPAAYAVATPLLTQSGAAVVVVRGATDVPAAPASSSPVEVTGILAPSTSSGSVLDEDRVTDGVRIPALVSEVSTDLYAGYVVLTKSEPEETLDTVQPPLAEPSRWAGIRNLLYAVQWWVFAGFVAFMWWRMTHDVSPDSPGMPAGQIASTP